MDPTDIIFSSELNPVVMKEMARLRNENMQLKAFAAKREDDSVQMLEERLDDRNRLADRFKEQFLTTKSQLEDTEQQLQLSQEHVANLRTQVEEMASRIEYLGQELDDYKAKLSKSQDVLANTSRQLQESMEREEGLSGDVAQITQKASDVEGLAAHRLELLDSTKADLQDTVSELHATQEREQSLLKEVAEWTEKTTAAETAFLECENQLSETTRKLDDVAASFDAALEREVEIKDRVDGLEKMKQALEDKIESEIQMNQEALLAKDKELEETRQNLEEEARRVLDEMNEYMAMSLDNERAAYEQQLAAASDAYAQLEQEAEVDCSQLQEKFEHDLQSTRTEFQEKVTKLEGSHASEIATVKQSAVEERKEIIAKGKAMLKETKERAEEELAAAENQFQKVEAELVELRRNHEAFEKRSKSRIASYKQKINFASGRITELSQSNDSKDETIEELEREKFKLREENERFRRQLGGRFGADGKVQNQLETLQKEFNAILDENRSLKKEIEKNEDPWRNGLSAISEASEAESVQRSYTRGGVSGSTLSQLRKEYEETIDALMDEKRSLVMRNSAAITDVQKAEQRAWESDKQVAKLKEELTSVKLALQRLERYSEEDQNETSGDDTKENEHSVPDPEDFKILTASSSSLYGPSLPAEEMLLDLGSSEVQAIPLSASTQENRTDHLTSSQFSTTTAGKPAVDAYEFPSDHGLRRRVSPGRGKKNDMQGVPTLMEYAMYSQNAPTDDAQPECQPS
jgi:chromosome segregation ATPase